MLTRILPTLATPARSLTVRPLRDDVFDSLGYDPRSSYVETFWLGVLGPSTTWLLRRMVAQLERSPDGYELPLAETARCLGLGDRGGRHSPFIRALSRLVQFDLAQPSGLELAVRRKVPPLNRRQIAHLPPSLQAAHAEQQEADLKRPPYEHLRARSRQLALSLLELGEDLEAAERQLLRWKFHPALARESAAWAWDKHRRALEAAEGACAGKAVSIGARRAEALEGGGADDGGDAA